MYFIAVRDKKISQTKLLLIAGIILVSLAACISYIASLSTNVKVISTLAAVTMLFIGCILLLGDKYIKYTLVLPSAVILFSVTVIPVIFLVTMSLTDVKLTNFNRQWNFVGLSNYIHFFTKDRLFFPAFIRTLEYTVVALFLQLIIGMGIAHLLQKQFLGRNLVSSLLVIPVMTCPIVIAMLWKSMMNSDNGVINSILGMAGIKPVHWLTNEPLGFLTVIPVAGDFIFRHLNGNIGFLSAILVNIWQWTPFVYLMILSGLSSLPHEPFEAAIVDGAGRWATFRYITLPLLKPVLDVVILMRLIDLMKVYDQIYALFGDNITMRTLNIHIFSIGLTNQDYGKGSALSVIVLIFIVALTRTFISINDRITQWGTK
jgi:multiple sugar transport system permease protein